MTLGALVRHSLHRLDIFPILARVAQTDEDWKARRGAVCSFAQHVLDDPRAKDVLRHVVEHDPDVRVSFSAKFGLRPDFRPGRAHAAKTQAERQAAAAV